MVSGQPVHPSNTMTERRVGRSCTTATARLKQDYIRLMKDPVPYVAAAPLPSNILEWHYVVTGPEETPYEGGLYHGKLIFPSQFPFKPPSIYMITPSGRFKVGYPEPSQRGTAIWSCSLAFPPHIPSISLIHILSFPSADQHSSLPIHF